jgi:hypothetical protein
MVKRFFNKISSGLNTIVPSILKAIQWFSYSSTTIFVVAIVIVGQIINAFQPFKYFHIYQLLVIPSILIASWAVKKFIADFESFNKVIASHPVNFVGIKLSRLIYSNWALPGLVLIGGLYVYSSYRLEYIQFDAVGLYALLMILLMLTTAIIGQTVYVYYILLLSRLNKESEFKYNFYMTAKTDWIVMIAKTGRMFNNCFFILGFIYTLVFYLNSPKGTILIDSTKGGFLKELLLTTPDNHAYLISWITIIVIIFIAFPIYYLIQNNYIKSLIRKLKDKSISEISMLMKAGAIKSQDNLELELKYLTLINNIENSAKKPIASYNIIPVISSICSISVHFIKISENLM